MKPQIAVEELDMLLRGGGWELVSKYLSAQIAQTESLMRAAKSSDELAQAAQRYLLLKDVLQIPSTLKRSYEIQLKNG